MPTFYTGVSLDNTPPNVAELMAKIADKLARQGVILRSPGPADLTCAFNTACRQAGGRYETFYPHQVTEEAVAIAGHYHDAWDMVSPYMRTWLGRYANMLMGTSMKEPSKCLICYTVDAAISHKTRTTNTGRFGILISIANHFKIPIYNLNHLPHRKLWVNFVNKQEEIA